MSWSFGVGGKTYEADKVKDLPEKEKEELKQCLRDGYKKEVLEKKSKSVFTREVPEFTKRQRGIFQQAYHLVDLDGRASESARKDALRAFNEFWKATGRERKPRNTKFDFGSYLAQREWRQGELCVSSSNWGTPHIANFELAIHFKKKLVFDVLVLFPGACSVEKDENGDWEKRLMNAWEAYWEKEMNDEIAMVDSLGSIGYCVFHEEIQNSLKRDPKGSFFVLLWKFFQ